MRKKPTAKKPTAKKIDAEGILRTLAEIRKGLPVPEGIKPPPPRPRHEGKIDSVQSMEDFEMEAIADGLESLAADVSGLVLEAELKLFNQALDVYYAAVDLTADGKNPEILPHLESMRSAYEKSYGAPIPPREKRDQALKDFHRARDKRK